MRFFSGKSVSKGTGRPAQAGRYLWIFLNRKFWLSWKFLKNLKKTHI